MFKIKILAIGKIKENYLQAGIKEYSKRLIPYAKVEIEELPDFPLPSKSINAGKNSLLEKEAEGIHKRLKNNTFLILLDVNGKEMSTPSLAEFIKLRGIKGNSHLSFVIGGTLGVASSLQARADLRLSLSAMTFPHQMARLILLEQIYRCFKINSGEQYHK